MSLPGGKTPGGGLPSVRQATRGVIPAVRSPQGLAAEPPARRLAVGFSRSPTLREALRSQLIALGHYRLDASPQIPDSPNGMLVGGQVAALRAEGGYFDCRARYFVARQPERAALFVSTVAASVPLLSLTDIAEGRAACLAELAVQIAARTSGQ